MHRGDIQRIVKAIRAAATLDEAMAIAIDFIIRPKSTQAVPSITCLRCHKTSYNENDVINRYCGYCQTFLTEGHYELRTP